MTPTAAILLLLSAGIHAGWNLLGKRSNPSAAFMLAANTLGCLFLLPSLWLAREAWPAFTPQIWRALVLTGACQAVYYAGLAGAYRFGNLSVAYPLARALPVLITALLAQALGLGAPLSPAALLSMLLVAFGCLVIPLDHLSDFHPRRYWNRACLLALLAALGTVGYSLIDSEALRLLRQQSAGLASGPSVTALYALLEGLSASAWLGLWVILRPNERRAFGSLSRPLWRQAVLVGAAIYAAYTLVLVAMGYVTNVSYVVAFRQVSIPLGALLGILVLKEPAYPARLAGAGMLFAGLALLGLA
jgi:drug/metabolite transporter (DMT)-like permease